MEHAGFALALSSLAVGVLCGLYRQYVIMFVTACILAMMAEQGEATHHWAYTVGNGVFMLAACSLLSAHVGFFGSRWIPWALSTGRKKAPQAGADEKITNVGQRASRQDDWKSLD